MSRLDYLVAERDRARENYAQLRDKVESLLVWIGPDEHPGAVESALDVQKVLDEHDDQPRLS